LWARENKAQGPLKDYPPYFVLRAGSRWLVTFDGMAMGRFSSRTEALEAAIVMADLMGAMHHDADVMVETTPDRPLELAWTFRPGATPPARQPLGTDTSVRHVQHGAAA